MADSPAGTLCDELDGGGKGDGDGVYGNCDSDHDGHGCDGIGDGGDVDSGHNGDGTFSDTSGKQNVTQE